MSRRALVLGVLLALLAGAGLAQFDMDKLVRDYAKKLAKERDPRERAAAARPEVMECYLMTGDSDYLLRVVVPDLEAYERFVMDFTKIPGLAQIRSSFALRPVKQGTALPLG